MMGMLEAILSRRELGHYLDLQKDALVHDFETNYGTYLDELGDFVEHLLAAGEEETLEIANLVNAECIARQSMVLGNSIAKQEAFFAFCADFCAFGTDETILWMQLMTMEFFVQTVYLPALCLEQPPHFQFNERDYWHYRNTRIGRHTDEGKRIKEEQQRIATEVGEELEAILTAEGSYNVDIMIRVHRLFSKALLIMTPEQLRPLSLRLHIAEFSFTRGFKTA